MAKCSKKETCKHCDVVWADHPGVEKTCESFRRARMTLAIIQTWFECGDYNLHHVSNLINRYFEENP